MKMVRATLRLYSFSYKTFGFQTEKSKEFVIKTAFITMHWRVTSLKKNISSPKKRKLFVAGLILLILCLVFAIPIILNYLFKIIPCFTFLIAEWNAGDALNYYGSVLSFLSTTILSILALWQTHIIREESNKHTSILENMEKERNAPRFFVKETTSLAGKAKLGVAITNCSDNAAHNIKMSKCKVIDSAGKLVWEEIINKEFPYLAPYQQIEGSFNNPALIPLLNTLIIQFSCTDKYGESHDWIATSEIRESNLAFIINKLAHECPIE